MEFLKLGTLIPVGKRKKTSLAGIFRDRGRVRETEKKSRKRERESIIFGTIIGIIQLTLCSFENKIQGSIKEDTNTFFLKENTG